MEVKVYNQEGKEKETLELNEAVFDVKIKSTVVHQVYTALLANAREPWADSKNKGEVSGGGRKPWRQKGTGRARHGSIRSPLWRGGGVTFGPLSIRNYKQKINKKMNRLAVKMCLSDKVNNNQLVVVENLPQDGKSKSLSAARKVVAGAGKRTLILTAGLDKQLLQAVKNIPRLSVQRAQDVNVVNLLNNTFIIITPGGIKVLEKRLIE